MHGASPPDPGLQSFPKPYDPYPSSKPVPEIEVETETEVDEDEVVLVFEEELVELLVAAIVTATKPKLSRV